jgi:multidrug transporter EmrE-like cation transporter
MNKKYLFLFAIVIIIGIRFLFVAILPTSGQTVAFHLEGLGDEPSHFNYVKYLAQKHALPVQTTTYKTPGALIRNDFEYYQPPLYYLLGAIGRELGGGIYFCRILSFVFGLVSLWLIARILKQAGCPPVEQAAGVLLCGIFPCHVYFCSLVSNDSMSWLAALALTYVLMEARNAPGAGPDFTWSRSLAIAVLLGLGGYIKSSMLLFFPIAAASFLYAYFRRKNGVILVRMAVSLGCALAINIPWFLRNMALYHSITGLSFLNGPAVPYPHLLTWQGFPIFLKTSVRFFWFPMQHIPVSTAHKLLGGVGAVMLTALAILSLRYIFKQRPLTYNVYLLIGIMAVTFAAFVQYNLIWGNREGRFLFPALSSIAFFMVVPLNAALKALRMERLFIPLGLFLGAWGYSYLLLTF